MICGSMDCGGSSCQNLPGSVGRSSRRQGCRTTASRQEPTNEKKDYRVKQPAQLKGLLWLKSNLVHSGHLDSVRGRQAIVTIRMSELLGDRRQPWDMRLRIKPQRLLLQHLLGEGIMRYGATEKKALYIRGGCNRVSAYRYHTVNSKGCQHGFSTDSGGKRTAGWKTSPPFTLTCKPV